MEDNKSFGFRVEKFHGRENEDFGLWQIRVLAMLEGQDLSGVVMGDEPVPESTEGSDEYKIYLDKIRKARAVIVMALGDRPLRAVQTAEGPMEMWSKLHERYAGSTTASKIGVLTTLMNTRYESGEDIRDYIAKFETMFNRLEIMGSHIDEAMQVAILLVSLLNDETLSSTVAAIKTMDEEKATWDYVTSRLMEEQRSRRLADDADENASKIKAATVHGDRKNSRRCYNCGKIGHIARNCRAKDNRKGRRRKEGDDDDKSVRAAVMKTTRKCVSFIVDSGATEHIANSMNVFTDLWDIDPIHVHMADDRMVTAKKMGRVRIDMAKSNQVLELSRVLYIPEAGLSMISCTQLDNHDISTMIMKGKVTFHDRRNKDVILGFAKRRSEDSLFVVDGTVITRPSTKVCAGRAKTEETESGVELWHQRLGHVSKDTVKKMSHGVVRGNEPEGQGRHHRLRHLCGRETDEVARNGKFNCERM